MKIDVRAWNWRVILRIVGAIMALIVLTWIFYRIFVLPDQLRTDAQQAKQDTRSAQGEVSVAHDVGNVMEARDQQQQVTREIVRENTREIFVAPGASSAIPPDVHRAGIAAIRRLRQQADQRNDAADPVPESNSGQPANRP